MTKSGIASFSIKETREIIKDLFVPKQWIYWTDLLVTLAIGYGFAAIYLREPLFSPLQIVSLLISGFALFRAGSYIHEITHMRQGEMLGFRIGWNLLCGIPMLMPSFFYENHIDHHNSKHYGTIKDGEYLPLGAGPLRQLIGFWAQVPLLPVYIFLRFLIGTPISFLHPRIRQWMLEHMSSFVINFRHRLSIPKNAPRKWWAALEIACCLRAWALIGFAAAGILGYTDASITRVPQLYCLALMTLGLNYIRNMTAHHYRNTGDEMSHAEQLEDSVNIEGTPILTELFFPLGLRYHALHHLFPSLPYHNLAQAHRRLMEKLPADNLYRETVYPSFWSVMRQLVADSRAATAGREPQHVLLGNETRAA